MNQTIRIASDYTKYPGPRYREHGPFSGEQFREEQLSPALKAVIASGDVLTIVLDGVAGYGSSFLEEAFGGLVREGFRREDIHGHLVIVAETGRFQHHRLRALQYIRDAMQLTAA
jgi:hypothetical protein